MAAFLKRRIIRIHPAFLVAAVLVAAFVVPVSNGALLYRTCVLRVGDLIWQTLRSTEFSYGGTFLRNPLPNVITASKRQISYEFWCYIGVAILAAARVL